MLDACRRGSGGPLACGEIAEKVAQLFGWRQTYQIEKVHKGIQHTNTLEKVVHQRSASSWLAVHSLQSQSDGGILDPDDRLLDVVDDREQIIANFEDDDAHGRHITGAPPHVGDRGDGASAGGSSVGSSSAGGNSPDLFISHLHPPCGQTDIEVTGEEQAGLTPLQVRRGSEPALNHLPVTAPAASPCDATKRWSAAPLMDEEPTPKSAVARKAAHRKEQQPRRTNENGHPWPEEEELSATPSPNSQSSAFSKFVRDSNRLSMQFLSDGGAKWMEAAERINAVPSAPRKEPLGANSSSPIHHPVSDAEEEDVIEYVVLRNEEGPLGIHVVPDYDRLGQDRGLLVQGIEPGGRIDQDGRLGFCDRIIEINGHNLLNMPFQTVQEIFRDSLKSPELRLRVVKYKHNLDVRRPPPPVFPNKAPSSGADSQPKRAHSEDRELVNMVEGEEKGPNVHTKVATVSPTKKVPSSAHPASRNANILITANTRKIGKKLEIELVKGPHGLGFSITTRDNPAGGNCPIYIKNILPKGAAVEDGRLKPGDRLLEVNGVAMTGKTQSEAVATLRNAPPGSTVSLVVSRQDKGDESPRLPRELSRAGNKFDRVTNNDDNCLQPMRSDEPPEKANDDGIIFPWKHREILTFDIPVHDTEKAGLGVSVKGKTSAVPGGSVDLGIFVKSVINGGAASRDGRLRTNDQLIDINGVSLIASNNSDAMETLRRNMHQEGPKPGVITLTVSRRVSSMQNLNTSTESATSGRDSANSLLSSSSGTEVFGYRGDGEGPTPENSCASETSENTVIFMPKVNGDVQRDVRPLDKKIINPMDPLANRNPVLDRLTGNAGLRNESYYRATMDSSWNANLTSMGNKFSSPTLHCPNGETVLIEDEYMTHQIIAPNPRRPEKFSIPPPDRQEQYPNPKSPHEPQTPSTPGAPGDATYASQLSLEVDPANFARDAVGRQSMSEKRHASLDAKNTDTYQRQKKAREERERQKNTSSEQPNSNEQLMNGHANGAVRNREFVSGMFRAASVESIISMNRSQAGSELDAKKGDIGPGLGMKKSSSLESLQTMVQEIQMMEDGEVAYTYRGNQGPVKVIRGRGCNESFRAAVDRSYDAPLGEMKPRMETPAAIPAREHVFLPPLPPPAKPRERAIDVFYPYAVSEEEAEVQPAGNFGRGSARQSSLNSALDNKYKKDGKKKAGLFKGIGSMFRFGKHRKGLENPLQGGKLTEEAEEADNQEKEREAARQAAQEEQQRIREQYQRLVQRQKQTEMQQQFEQMQMQDQGVTSRTDRIHQLRAQHQRRHVERRGQYPLDEREERYEQAIRQRLETPPQPEHHPVMQVTHRRNPSYDLYGDRPVSRSGDPARYSHYVNYEEIQHHLSKRTEQLSEQQIVQMRQQVQLQRVKVEAEDESRRQMHYHSQRRDPREMAQQRPVSNFFEYESVTRAGQHTMLHPVHHHQQQMHPAHMLRDANANSLPRKDRPDPRTEFQTPKHRGQFVNIQPHQQYPSPDNNNMNPMHFTKQHQQQQRLPPDSYVPVHRSTARIANGFAKMPPGSKV
ncbi:partitioning defective 3 homolog isoform X3 [Neocloeon triangulifer]|uniref:partitioning defective 3 homolog isoform X3 n=1 Tax=Neocloeon triangulifer TaxID=2078957 RepID=UPI00286EF8D2|nr:partitioning defective 3 homolog isoform X3 [Neocloeon triangulifer]